MRNTRRIDIMFSPAITPDGLVLVSSTGGENVINAFSANDGKPQWRHYIDDTVVDTPIVVDNTTIIVPCKYICHVIQNRPIIPNRCHKRPAEPTDNDTPSQRLCIDDDGGKS